MVNCINRIRQPYFVFLTKNLRQCPTGATEKTSQEHEDETFQVELCRLKEINFYFKIKIFFKDLLYKQTEKAPKKYT